ncbi:hypothetical protein RJ639_010565 [Escallonia herrerae]|uniref:Reverse transcriptase Ty1/copia-type domain-containing protein n=1 Tax=Escallonia herrerae TaxID=1293975 RepID=A0AA88VP25_9ASTE|nr:hypothetical protein RJ639_010565 [Escallonia herrerae]
MRLGHLNFDGLQVMSKKSMVKEAWSGFKPSVSHLRIFGSIAYAHVSNEKRSKLDDKSERYVFIGYDQSSKGYKLYNPSNGMIVINRDVEFDEESSWEWKIQNEDYNYNPFFDDGEEMMQPTAPPPTLPPQNPQVEEVSSSEGPRRYRNLRDIYGATDEINKSGDIFFVCLYVDDLIVTGNNLKMFEEFKEEMAREFEMTDIGLMSYYLGIEVRQREDGIFISQEAYAKEILKRYRMVYCKPVKTPVECGVKVSKHGEGDNIHPTFFKSLVGSLRYLTCTRLDILFGVGLVSRYMEAPTTSHLKMAKRILRYIKGTLDYGIMYSSSQDFKLVGYCDSDWAGDKDDRKSTTGSLLMELHQTQDCPTKILVDNKSALELAKNPVFHERSKHIDTKYHFIRECVSKKEVELEYVKSQDQVADIFTKPLKIDVFHKLRMSLGVMNQV